jgi:hypothetical protein
MLFRIRIDPVMRLMRPASHKKIHRQSKIFKCDLALFAFGSWTVGHAAVSEIGAPSSEPWLATSGPIGVARSY